MNNDDRQRLQADEQIINSNWASLHAAFTRVISETGNGDCPDQLHADLEKEIRLMYYKMRSKREHDAVADLWDEYNIDHIPHLCAVPHQVQTGGVGHLGIDTTRTETRIRRAPLEYLVKWTTAFDEIFDALEWTKAAKSEAGDMFSIKRDPENYPQAVKDDIPKPE